MAHYLLEKWINVLPFPAGIPQGSPLIVDRGGAAAIEEAIGDGAPAQSSSACFKVNGFTITGVLTVDIRR
jgi:hypothetical protein